MDFKQTYYNAGGVKTRAIEAGDGPPLILLHGTGGHAEAYLKNIEAHAQHFHVYAIDMVGHGYSDAPDISYEMQCYVDFMKDFLDAIGADKAHISGESLGATGRLLVRPAIPATGRQDRHEHRHDAAAGTREGAEELKDLLERSRKATGSPDRNALRQRIPLVDAPG